MIIGTRNIIRRFLCLFIIPIILCCNLSKVEAKDIYVTSNYEKEILSISCDDNKLNFLRFPDNGFFEYVIIHIVDKDGKVVFGENQSFSTKSAIKVDLNNLKDGNYYIEIYYSKEQYATYTSYMYGKRGICLKVVDGKLEFLDSPVYESNKQIFENRSMSSSIREKALETTKDIQSDDQTIISLANKITTGLTSDYEKAIAIHDWICNNIWYDRDVLLGRVPYGDVSATATLSTKRSVCQGYANLTAALLRAVNIPTTVVSGYALGVTSVGEWSDDIIKSAESNHAWNEAYIDGRWVIMDTTWDTNHTYENGKYSKTTGLSGYKYFDPNIRNFSNDHYYIEQVVYQKDHTTEDIIRYGIKKPYKTLKLTLGKARNLGCAYYEPYVTEELQNNTTVQYSSSNKKVVTVDAYGNVTAKGYGVAKVTTKLNILGEKVEFTTKVTVNAAECFSKPATKTTVMVGKNKTIAPKVLKPVSEYTITYKSSNKKIAKVSSKGKITGLKAGSATITTTIKAYDQTFTYTTKVTVKKG